MLENYSPFAISVKPPLCFETVMASPDIRMAVLSGAISDPELIVALFLLHTGHPCLIRESVAFRKREVSQAIARLGEAQEYWREVYNAFLQGRLTVYNIFNACLLPLDNRSGVPQVFFHNTQAHVLQLNYGGDMDLVKLRERTSVFPIIDNRYPAARQVSAADLGVDEVLGALINKLYWQVKDLQKSVRDDTLAYLRRPENKKYPAARELAMVEKEKGSVSSKSLATLMGILCNETVIDELTGVFFLNELARLME